MLKANVLAGVAAAKIAVQDLALSATLIIQGEAVHVPGQAPEYPTDEYSVSLVWDGIKTSEIDGDRIRATDLKALIFPEDDQPVPNTNDVISVSDTEYRVIFNDKVMAGDTVALSQVYLRLKSIPS